MAKPMRTGSAASAGSDSEAVAPSATSIWMRVRRAFMVLLQALKLSLFRAEHALQHALRCQWQAADALVRSRTHRIRDGRGDRVDADLAHALRAEGSAGLVRFYDNGIELVGCLSEGRNLVV